ncbi:MAG: hypothetical protein LBS89_05765 [Zoogloeaceae bacterium]|nr:hypothetical protein [Zoogloeaceae bacterium]
MKLRTCSIVLAWVVVFGSPSIQAAPALYYLWMSKLDGSRLCSQTSLGEGWQRVGGPFKDSRCRKPA